VRVSRTVSAVPRPTAKVGHGPTGARAKGRVNQPLRPAAAERRHHDLVVEVFIQDKTLRRRGSAFFAKRVLKAKAASLGGQ
jgi:hypothetical protein